MAGYGKETVEMKAEGFSCHKRTMLAHTTLLLQRTVTESAARVPNSPAGISRLSCLFQTSKSYMFHHFAARAAATCLPSQILESLFSRTPIGSRCKGEGM